MSSITPPLRASGSSNPDEADTSNTIGGGKVGGGGEREAHTGISPSLLRLNLMPPPLTLPLQQQEEDRKKKKKSRKKEEQNGKKKSKKGRAATIHLDSSPVKSSSSSSRRKRHQSHSRKNSPLSASYEENENETILSKSASTTPRTLQTQKSFSIYELAAALGQRKDQLTNSFSASSSAILSPSSSASSSGSSGQLSLDEERDKNKYLSSSKQRNRSVTADPPLIRSFSLSKTQDETETTKEKAVEEERDEEEMMEQRDRFVREVLTMESNYLKNLEILVQVYARKLQSWEELSRKQAIGLIFTQFEGFLDQHSRFQQSMKRRVDEASWNVKTSHFSDIFLKEGGFMRTYGAYFLSYVYSVNAINKLKAKSRTFAAFLDTCDKQAEETGMTTLDSLLICPIQQIPRYALLFSKLMEVTPESHPDYNNTAKALRMLKNLNTELNEKKRQAEQAVAAKKETEEILSRSNEKLRRVKKPKVKKSLLCLKLQTSNLQILERLSAVECPSSGVEVYGCCIEGWLCAMKQHQSAEDFAILEQELNILEGLPYHMNIERYLFHEFVDNKLRVFTTRYDCNLRHVLDLRIKLQAKHPEDDYSLSTSQIVSYALDIIRGLEFLHEHRIVHRELQPENILGFFEPSTLLFKHLAIGNFEHAKKITSSASTRKRSLLTSSSSSGVGGGGSIRGVAPEVLASFGIGSSSNLLSLPSSSSSSLSASTSPRTLSSGNINNSQREEASNGLHHQQHARYSYAADVWSFGMVLYELITFNKPYVDEKEDHLVMEKIARGERPPLLLPSSPRNGDHKNEKEGTEGEEAGKKKKKTKKPVQQQQQRTREHKDLIPLISLFEDCTEFHPEKRPNAAHIKQALLEILEED
ncbi:Intersectin 1 (SH3 domain protein) [Balamuthia mandrillaris]